MLVRSARSSGKQGGPGGGAGFGPGFVEIAVCGQDGGVDGQGGGGQGPGRHLNVLVNLKGVGGAALLQPGQRKEGAMREAGGVGGDQALSEGCDLVEFSVIRYWLLRWRRRGDLAGRWKMGD